VIITTGRRWLGTTVIVIAALLYLLLIMVSVRSGRGVWAIWTVYLLYAVVGGLVLRHSARNPIGILVAVMGVIPLLGNLAEIAVVDGAPSGLPGDLAAWIVIWYFYSFIGAFIPLFHVFPSGRPMTGVWRWWYRVALVGSGLLLFNGMFGRPDGAVNPFEIPFEVPAISVVVFPVLLAGLMTGVISLAIRFRRSRDRERDQLKWFFSSVAVAVSVFFASAFFSEGLGWIPVGLGEAVASATFPIPALGILVAVTRHNLFDIDRIVSRTVSYAAIALVIAAVYAIPVVILPNLLGLSSDLSVALATLAAAAVFTPVRRRLQSTMARRFDRHRYDAERVVEAFSGRLQTAVDLGVVTDELRSAVGVALRPAAISVWFTGSVTVPERS
jgi:uncharacterized membrane protein YhaH (DUF805 family)